MHSSLGCSHVDQDGRGGCGCLPPPRRRSGPALDYDFPGFACFSEGEHVKIDVTAELDGYYADDAPLHPGLVLTIEPILAAGRGDVILMPDGWTVCTLDGSQVAHAEHTVVVREGTAPLVLTA
jgi:methionyl aminopeptidase